MYKLSNTYICKMIEKKCCSSEIDFLLYIAEFQDTTGRIESVYYKDVCKEIKISIQKFYDILSSLTEKGLIVFHKIRRTDICVTLLGNNFYAKRYKKGEQGYLKVTARDFKNQKFRDLKAGSKLLYLYMQRFVKGKHMPLKQFYNEFSKLFGVKSKSLKKYMRELKENLFLHIGRMRNKSNTYEITIKRSEILDIPQKKIKNENQSYFDNIKDLIRRNFKKQLPEVREERVLQDIVNLTTTKRNRIYQNIIVLLYQAIENSIMQQQKEKKKSILNAALINICLTSVIDEYEKKKYNACVS